MAMAAQMAIINARSEFLTERLDSMNIAANQMPAVTIEGFNFSTDLVKRAPAQVRVGMLIYVAYNDQGAGVQQDAASIAANICHLFLMVKSVGPNFILQFVHQSGIDGIAAAQQLALGTEIAIPRNTL